MALKGYMQVKDADGVIIVGESIDTDRTDWIEVWGGSHTVKLPTTSNGLPNGRRTHFPIHVTKEVDRTSPLFNQFLSTGALLSEVIIDWYRINPKTSLAEAYFRQTLNQAQVNAVQFTMQQRAIAPWDANPEHNMGHMEQIQLIYDDITWTILDGGVEYDDSQRPQTKAAPVQQSQQNDKPQKKKHLIHIEAKVDGKRSLPDRHKVTIVVISNSTNTVVIKQPKDLIHEPESRQFKVEAGEEFKVYCVPPHLDAAIDDLRANDNLDQSESEGLIEPLEITTTEVRQDDITVHLTEYLIPDIKEFTFSA